MTITLNGPRGLLESVRQGLWWIPNGLTLARIAAAVGIVVLFLWGRITYMFPEFVPSFDSYRVFGFYLATIVVVTDLLDGWIARTFGWTSDTGKWLDPLADKFASLGIGLAVPLEYGMGWYVLPYFAASYFLLKYSWETSKLRFRGAISGANRPAQIKTFVLMGSQFLFMGDIAYGELLNSGGQLVLQTTAITRFVASAALNKWSLSEYVKNTPRHPE